MMKKCGVFLQICFLVVLITFPVPGTGYAREAGSGLQRLALDGELVATEISKATGLAISPILGISVLGAYSYYTTPPEARDRVPWHVSPRFWSPLLAVLFLIVCKDCLKVALPKIILAPLDVVEALLEKNTSAVLALLVVLTSITGKGVEQVQVALLRLADWLVPVALASEAGVRNEAVGMGLWAVLGISFFLGVIFLVVWVVAQSFHFLILLCPFSWGDLMLNLAKNSLLVLLLGAYLVHPFLGLFVSVCIIAASVWLFSWSFRFVVFGTLFSLDLFGRANRRISVERVGITGFSGPDLKGVPSMSYGRVVRKEERLEFVYRPWFCLGSRTVPVPRSPDSYSISRGVFADSLVRIEAPSGGQTILLRLRPRYKGHEAELAHILGLAGRTEPAVGKSFGDGVRWLKEQME